MKRLTSAICLFICISHFLMAQTIRVQPYLQDATPNSIYILWETDSGDESLVQWGLTNSLGNETIGTAVNTVGNAYIHEVKIEGLERFTKYYYRVKTGSTYSGVYTFKTPPFASDNESFRIIAMADMQQDADEPDKFEEIIQDGIIDYLEDEVGGDLVDNIALVIIPGDLVENGEDYPQWEETFFTPAQDIFREVPSYPIRGNREGNGVYFFQFFKLPDNGTAGFEENWYYTDYGNVRIIGLNTNQGFRNQQQLDWLDTVLASTCVADSIDFVFAQVHHPHKSEIRLASEIDYTGEIIEKLEDLTTNCGKPSIHFFGHTHAYSRGHSRDHKHLWINAASAGGKLKNWENSVIFDYDEFAVTQDEYGFLSVEVTSDPDPMVVIKRISRGDDLEIKDNEYSDSMVVRLNPTFIETPLPVYPIHEEVHPECVLLKANTFSSPNASALHGQSHWQVATSSNDFSQPSAESWKNFENYFDKVNTQAGDDMADEQMSALDENTNYWWRVRYRDRELNWSAWSTPIAFSTGPFDPTIDCATVVYHTDVVLDLSDITIFSNPDADLFSIKGITSNYDIDILDANGTVYQNINTSSNIEIDLSGLPAGLFFVRIQSTTDSGVCFRKIIKN